MIITSNMKTKAVVAFPALGDICRVTGSGPVFQSDFQSNYETINAQILYTEDFVSTTEKYT
jgi:hypothetical protein